MLPDETVPRALQGRAPPDQVPIEIVAFPRVVECANDGVQFALRPGSGGLTGAARSGRIEKRRLLHRIHPPGIDHMPNAAVAMVIVDRQGFALVDRLLELFGGRGRGGSRIHDDLKTHVWRAAAVGERFAGSNDQTRNQRCALGQRTSRGSRSGPLKFVDVVIRHIQRAVELIQRHHRRCGNVRQCA